jgi:dTDP-4-amino-4,6-dideoxygalactose transaminase
VISDQTSAILGVHIWGHACDMERLASLSKRHRLNLIFDACHAFGCTYRRRKIGNFGDAEVFSFHATKSVNSAEGGAIATNDDDLADRIRMMRSFGFSGTDQVRELGINGKMSELSAAVGLTSLEHMDLIHTWNRSNFRHYRAQLDGIPGVSLFESPEGESFNFHYVVVRVEEASSGLHRDDLYEVLRCEGILARRYFAPGCHQIRPYSRQPPRTPLPVTEAAAESVLSLPTGLSAGPEEVRNVCQIIRIAVANADVIRSQRFRHGCPSAVGADQLSARESESI